MFGFLSSGFESGAFDFAARGDDTGRQANDPGSEDA